MLAREQAYPFLGFKGLDRSKPVPEPGYTRSLLNVNIRDGKVTGRGGVDFNTDFSTQLNAAGTPENVLQLMPYLGQDSGLTTTLLRIGATKIEKSTSGTWTDITGTDLTGSSSNRPQYTMFRDKLYFVNSGEDRMRSWSGSSNTVAISVAPWAHGILSYFGFLFALRFSTDGSTFLRRSALYSDDPDNTWELCEGNILNFHETPGALQAGSVFGRTALIYKEDAVIYLRWTGGTTRFAQELIKGVPGTLAPLSVQSLGEKGCIHLGDDLELYIITSSDAIPLPPRVNDILQRELYKPLVADCRSAVVAADETYYLFIPLDNTGNKGRIQVNYRTGECSYSTYASHAWDAVTNIRWNTDNSETIVGAVDTRTYTLDVATVKVDEISASTQATVTRRYDTDWFQFANVNEGRQVSTGAVFTGATLVFAARDYTRCKISIAVDKKNRFKYPKTFDLTPVYKDDEYVAVRYDLPGIAGEWFNLRIEFLPSTTQNPRLEAMFVHFVSEEKRAVNRGAANT